MISIAAMVSDWLEDNPKATPDEVNAKLEQIPEWQFRAVGGWWPVLRTRCPYILTSKEDIRGKNALHVDIIDPLERCSLLPPDGRGVTRDGSTHDWLKSGGSVLAYGQCWQSSCYWCGNGAMKREKTA